MKYNKDLFLFTLIYGKTLKGQTVCFVWSLHVTSWKKGLFLFCNVGLLGCCDHYNQQCGWGGVGGGGPREKERGVPYYSTLNQPSRN